MTDGSGRDYAFTTAPLLRHLGAEARSTGELHYATAGNVVLSAAARGELKRIADDYYEETGRLLYVTSGTRTPKKQAEAMYDNLANHRNQNPPYKDQHAFNEIKATYELGVRQRLSKSTTVNMMSGVIEKQVARGTYISRHLRGTGIDIRMSGMSRGDKRAFERVVDHVLQIDARGHHHWFLKTDHYHVQF
jgi:hypothetical protein